MNFSSSFKIGQGGYGTVYRGQLEDGTFVAIKRAKKVSPWLWKSPQFWFSYFNSQITNTKVNLVFTKLFLQSVYDKHLGAEFQSEIQTLAQVEHLNLVRLYGFLEEGDERIIIVEFVANGTLREHLDCKFSLFNSSWSASSVTLFTHLIVWLEQQINVGSRGTVLSLAVRLDIAIDVAHAVTYLHTYTGTPYKQFETDKFPNWDVL